jgi:hypothetical protein
VPLADGNQANDMAAVLDWRLPELTPKPGPLPWLPGIPPTLHAHPVWGTYLAKRSQLVADLAKQVQDHLCQSDAKPVWAAPETHLSTALIREIAVWRAANGINPQDPRPTGGFQLDTAAALWKQRLDRHIARSTDSSGNETFDERQAANTAPSRSQHHSRRPYPTPASVRTGQPHPAANPRRVACVGAAVSTSPSACWSDGPRRSFGCQWSPTFSCVCCRALKPNGPCGRLGHAELPHPSPP